MKITRGNAMRFWEACYGNARYAEDFHGNLMCKEGYGDTEFYIVERGRKIYCGWNIHHILPAAHGGTNAKVNLLCTNIITNEEAEDKITFWIDNILYQVHRIPETKEYEIIKIS